MAEEKVKKNKKINKMTEDELNSALSKSLETMNGEQSLYVSHLRQRIAELQARK